MGLSTGTNTNNSLSDYSANTSYNGNSGIITNVENKNVVKNAKLTDNNEVETVDLVSDTDYDNYFDTSTEQKKRDFFEHVLNTYGIHNNESLDKLTEEEKAMLYETLKINGMEDTFEDIETITSNKGAFSIKYKDGTSRLICAGYLNDEKGNSYLSGYYQYGYSNKSISDQLSKAIVEQLGILMFDVYSIDYKDGKMIVKATDGKIYELDEKTHSLLDIKNNDGKSIYKETLSNYYDTSTKDKANKVFTEMICTL